MSQSGSSSSVEVIDRQILELLAKDGRMSYTDLGKATGLSTSAVHQRVKRLEQRGLILGYGATVNHDGDRAAAHGLHRDRPVRPVPARRLPRAAPAPPRDRVLLVRRRRGVLRIKVRSHSPAELEELLARIRAAANVSTRTTIVLSTYYENRPVTG